MKEKVYKFYTVTLRFQFPPWDEVNGIVFEHVSGYSKSDACSSARLQAEHDGHLSSQKGLAWFKAVEETDYVENP